VQRLPQVGIVGQRLAHAHHDDVADACCVRREPQPALEVEHLRDDLAGRQVALQAHLRGGAEGAAHGAAGLAADADGVAPVVAHQHRLDQLAIVQAKEGLGGVAVA
jgi:hypothetical protein